MSVRRLCFALFLAAGLAAGFGLAGASASGRPLPNPHAWVLAFVVAAAALLLWLRPRPDVYGLGLLCVFVAFLGVWLGSPDALRHGPFGARGLGWLFMLFPIGWVLLAESVGSWKVGVASYLLAAVLFAVMGLVTGLFGPPGNMLRPWMIAIIALLWPHYTLAFLRVFGALPYE